MERLYPQLILDALANVRYPGTGKDIVSSGMVADDIRIDGNKVSFSIIFDKPTDPFMKSLIKSAETAITTFIGDFVDIKGNISAIVRNPRPEKPANPLPGVKNIIGVSSGKGGVGKSTIAANLAVALAQLGYKVGLLDADIFGPSVPKMFGVEDAKLYMETVDGRDLIIPIEKYGVKLLSIGFLVDPEKAVLWRGGMASNALKQLITEANWGDLDYPEEGQDRFIALGRPRLLCHRYASRHKRHSPHSRTNFGNNRRHSGFHSTRSGSRRCP